MEKHEININFEKGEDIKNELFAVAVENFLFDNCKVLEYLEESATGNEFFKSKGNFLGANGYLMQIKGGGVIRYLEAINLLNLYTAHIEIDGIEENKEKTNNIISQLEKIAKAKSLSDVKEFLPEILRREMN